MTKRTASLGMYDLPALREANDALWLALSGWLQDKGSEDVPQHLDRERPLAEIWDDPNLLLAQTCGLPFATRWLDRLRYVATPIYDVPGCEGPRYRGRPISQARIRELAAGPGVTILCGRFEGFDERIFAARAVEEIGVGDIVLSGGEPAALMLLDACIRLLPGVMGAPSSGAEESFEDGLLEYPHYTRPVEWEGRTIPEVLRSGDHAKIAAWRKARANDDTRSRRPDLWERHNGVRVQSASGAQQRTKDQDT